MASFDNSTHSGDGPGSDSSDSMIQPSTPFPSASSTESPSMTASRTPSKASSKGTIPAALSPEPQPTDTAETAKVESSVESVESRLKTPVATRPTTEASSNTAQTTVPQTTVSTTLPATGIGFGSPQSTFTTIVTSLPENTGAVVVVPTTIKTTVIVPSTVPTSGQTGPSTGVQEEHPPLSNGATAGIVLAVVAVLLGTFFLVRYIYEKRSLCSRSQPFSPTQEPYHRPPPCPISYPISGDTRRHSWLSHPGSHSGGQNYPSVVITPSRDESIELQSFTRPVHGPRMYDVGHSGNAPIAPPYNGYPQQENQGAPTSRPPTAPPANQIGQEEPVSPESPHVSASVSEPEGRAAAPRNRAGAVPWEDGYRYRAW